MPQNSLALAMILVLVLLSNASARSSLMLDHGQLLGRALLQAACDASRVPFCSTCRYTRINGATISVCVSCKPGYQASNGVCVCASGYAWNGTACAVCPLGSFCAGDNTTATPCGAGLTTLIVGASRSEQCVSLPGYGLSTSDATSAAACPIGSFSSGKTRSPCRACGKGLTTNATASISAYDCLAPPGYFLDRGSAKPCPRGLYTTANNRNSFCAACAAGVTTPGTAATSPAACSLAKPGFFLDSPHTASKCPLNTFRAGIAVATRCTQCPPAMVTLARGGTTRTACMAPRGYEFINETVGAAPCGIGLFKDGSNRRRCTSCGAGFLTMSTGSFTFSSCYIQVGWGTKRLNTTWMAYQCSPGEYGVPVPTFGVRNVPCTPCADGMTSPAGSSAPSACVTLPGYGYSSGAQTAKVCDFGSYSPGGARDECVQCGEGYTTNALGASSAVDCVIAPGYGYTGPDTDPAECAKGMYGPGRTADAPCFTCANSSTSMLDAGATSPGECSLCVYGYGFVGDGAGPNNCNICPPDTWSPGDSTDCSACPDGKTSGAGAGGADECLAPWAKVPAVSDTISMPTAVVVAGAADAGACKAACGASSSCMFYAWDKLASVCTHGEALAGGSAGAGFKAVLGTYTVWPWDAAVALGAPLGAPFAAPSVEACTAACDKRDSCVLVVWDGASCALRTTEQDTSIGACEYRSVGARFDAWPTSAPSVRRRQI